jgi:hypothetical protein
VTYSAIPALKEYSEIIDRKAKCHLYRMLPRNRFRQESDQWRPDLCLLARLSNYNMIPVSPLHTSDGCCKFTVQTVRDGTLHVHKVLSVVHPCSNSTGVGGGGFIPPLQRYPGPQLY